VPRANKLLRLVDLFGIILIAIAGGLLGIILISSAVGSFFSHYTTKRSDTEATQNSQPRIQPAPPTVEPQTESMILKQDGIRPLFPTKEPQQQVREATSSQPSIQPSPPTVESQQQVREATPDPPVTEPLPPTIESQPRSATARAENINANLCEASSRHAIERILSSVPTKELAKYIEGLKKGSYAFNWTISGDDDARQHGFRRRFAVIHGQVVEEGSAGSTGTQKQCAH
jgi:hypothetical protein